MNRCKIYTLHLLRAVLALLSVIAVPSASGQSYFLNGDAVSLGEDCYRLTAAQNYQNGTVWYGNQIDLSQPFDIQFKMNLGSNDANGADGICFVLQTVGTAAIGQSGGGMGYLNFGTSLGIEFDTWQNSEYNDPAYDHIAVHRNGNIYHNSPDNLAGPVQMHPFNANTEDGQDHVVQINWDPATYTIQVYFDCYFRLQAYVDLVNSIFGGQNLVYWGFTAATGGAVNNQTVCLQENILNVGDAVTICPGASTVLSAGASLNGTYLWSPADFLSDPEAAAPIATPPVTTTYNVQFTDLCGNNVSADITVYVEPLSINLPPLVQLTCANPEVQVQADSNFAFTTFVWSDETGNQLSETNQLLITTPGIYTVDAAALEGCTASASIDVVDNTSPPIVDVGDDLILNCTNPTVQLTATTTAGQPSVVWTTSGGGVLSPSSSLTPTIYSPGTFTLTVTDLLNGCIGSDQLTVSGNFLEPVISLPPQDSLSCLKSEITIANLSVQAEGELSYLWETEDGHILTGSQSSSPVINSAGTYTLFVTDQANGCSAMAWIDIVAAADISMDLSTLDFPNVITPNGDNLNGVWRPFLRADPQADLTPFLPVFELKIFNRWGSQLFETRNATNGWTATDVEDGVYYYQVRFETACGGGLRGQREGYIHVMK